MISEVAKTRARERLIKKRKSYKTFKDLYAKMKDKPLDEQIIAVFEMIDNDRMFGSTRLSIITRESIDLIIKENKNQQK